MRLLLLWILGLLLSSPIFILVLKRWGEKRISQFVLASTVLITLLWLGILAKYMIQFPAAIEIELFDVKPFHYFDFPLILYLDGFSVLFFSVSLALFGPVMRFSRYYLHREEGYARFFVVIFVFLLGLFITFLSGTFGVFFAGWELVGLSSFLLIGFYHYQINPIKNALKVFAIYRICDIGMLLGPVLDQIAWHKAHTWSDYAAHPLLQQSSSHSMLALLSGLILIAAMGKSAQFPFSYWVTRAMEGPTPSSAIFYGALSIHAGVFLLIRTYFIWSSFEWVRLAMATVGLLTIGCSFICKKSQATIKGKLAYASVEQVGFMFVELALGWRYLASIHFICNAFLRTYQLLVSPSVVAHLIRLQTKTGFTLRPSRLGYFLNPKWRKYFLAFSLHDAYMESLVHSFLISPVKAVPRLLKKYPVTSVAVIVAAAVFLKKTTPANLPTVLLLFLSLCISISSMNEKESPLRAWMEWGFSYLALLDTCCVAHYENSLILFYFGLSSFFWLLGFVALRSVLAPQTKVNLVFFNGLQKQNPLAAYGFLLTALFFLGLPIFPSFYFEDVLMHGIAEGHICLALFAAVNLTVLGYSVMRIYSKVFLGRTSS